jgi:hypothetical protein
MSLSTSASALTWKYVLLMRVARLASVPLVRIINNTTPIATRPLRERKAMSKKRKALNMVGHCDD